MEEKHRCFWCRIMTDRAVAVLGGSGMVAMRALTFPFVPIAFALRIVQSAWQHASNHVVSDIIHRYRLSKMTPEERAAAERAEMSPFHQILEQMKRANSEDDDEEPTH